MIDLRKYDFNNFTYNFLYINSEIEKLFITNNKYHLLKENNFSIEINLYEQLISNKDLDLLTTFLVFWEEEKVFLNDKEKEKSNKLLERLEKIYNSEIDSTDEALERDDKARDNWYRDYVNNLQASY